MEEHMASITSAPTAETSVASASSQDAPTREPVIWVNGKMLPKSQAAVSVFDHGLLYGDGIFEGIRIYNGKIFKLGQHMDRLYECADKIFLDVGVSREEMIDIQRQCVEANGIKNGYIRLIVTRGEGSLGLNPYQCPKAGVICIADTIALFPPEMYESGMRVALAQRPKTPIACLDPRIKTLNYLNNIMAKCEAIHLTQKLGITDPKDQLLEVIMLSMDGQVSEGSGDNIFVIKDGKIFTPPSEVGILEGITRRFVKDELCPMLGLTVEEKLFGIEDVYEADEVFLTGSAAEMIAVREVLTHDNLEVTGTHTISNGEGPITNALRTKFREIVTSDNVPED
jgi:branched-chain amino acid aminotransferase